MSPWRLVLLVSVLALAACGGPRKAATSPQDSEYRRLEQGARGAFARGELEYARDLYQRQLVHAQRSDSPRRIGDSAYNLAACEIALGNTDHARTLLDEARFEWDRAGEALAPVHVVRARLELQAGDRAACLEAAARALEPGSGASSRERVEALALRGLALTPSAERGSPSAELGSADRGAANEALHEALELSGPDSIPASVLRLQARLAEAAGDFPSAAETFEREAAVLQELGRYDFMSRALELAGRAWLASGDTSRAGDRLLRAARSRFAHALGREVPARSAILDLASAAELCSLIAESGALELDASLAGRLAPLVAEIDGERERVQAVLDVLDVGEALDRP